MLSTIHTRMIVMTVDFITDLVLTTPIAVKIVCIALRRGFRGNINVKSVSVAENTIAPSMNVDTQKVVPERKDGQNIDDETEQEREGRRRRAHSHPRS